MTANEFKSKTGLSATVTVLRMDLSTAQLMELVRRAEVARTAGQSPLTRRGERHWSYEDSVVTPFTVRGLEF